MKSCARDYFAYLVKEIHTTIVATVDENNLPVTCAVDMMDCDDDSLYFLTARGKSLYQRLKNRAYLSLTALKGDDTMSSVALSVSGKVRELGEAPLKKLFEKNPYMFEIYPTEASRSALTVFQIYAGSGEWFDLSKKPIERASFAFGGATQAQEGYLVTDQCIGCGACETKCPQKCIDISQIPARISQTHCIRCGNCFEICPVGAIEKIG
ncbi:MAG: 4Fe-4S binding protein [Eubacterium sp.]|nr:4Fe-4S binding protein [Eubacterium sp.]